MTLPYWLLAVLLASLGGYGAGRVHQSRFDSAAAVEHQLESTQEARRFEQHRQRNIDGAINGYITAKTVAERKAAATAADNRRVLDDLAAARLAIDAASADGDPGIEPGECGRLLTESAVLLERSGDLGEEGQGLVNRMAAKEAALQAIVRGMRVEP